MGDKVVNKAIGFTSRYGLIVSMIAGSAGLGNIWRFPRMAALYGGGTFVLLWTVFMILMCLPAIIAEAGIGRATRHAPPGAFRDFIGKKFTWMGSFLTLTLTVITSFYCVVMGWVLYYVIKGVSGKLVGADTVTMFDHISNKNYFTVILFSVSLFATAYIVYLGVSNGIEKVNKIMLPAIVVILVLLAVRTIMLPGGLSGLNYLFEIQPSYFADPGTWLAAMSQAAWSVGPGWGFILTYSIYSSKKQDVALTQTSQGFGDNSIALLAGMMILPAVFASVSTTEEALAISASGNYGLTFISMIDISSEIAGGAILLALFFIALYAAALSSAISMLIVPVQSLLDIGWSRKKAVLVTTAVCFILGLPSAWSISFLSNQDWVSGMALLIGTVFLCFVIIKFGTEKFRTRYLNIPTRDATVGRIFNIGITYITPGLVVVMFAWYVIDAIKADTQNWWNPLSTSSVGTFVLQVVVWIIVLKIFNNKMADSVKYKYFKDDGYPDIPKNLL